MSLLTSYSADNFVLVKDYNKRFNQTMAGEPQVSIEILSGSPIVTIAQWYQGVMEETASFKYIGMTYDAAMDCAEDMRQALTYSQAPWTFGDYISSDTYQGGISAYFLRGWHEGVALPTCESQIQVNHHDKGCMYDVSVQAKCTTIKYDKLGQALDISQHPLIDTLQTFAGWNEEMQLSGKYFDAACDANITIVNAPTRQISWELTRENILTRKSDNLSAITLSNWYKYTIDSQAQIRYEGMTKSACRALHNLISDPNTLQLSAHPYGFASEDGNMTWKAISSVTQYQNLNDFTATETDSGMFTAELTLHAQEITMTDTPTPPTHLSWPSGWSKVPGLSAYL